MPNEEREVPAGARYSGASFRRRQAIMEVVDGNSHRLQQWLDDVAERDGPAAAIVIYVKMLEFVVPKLARQELVNENVGPQELIVRWLLSTD